MKKSVSRQSKRLSKIFAVNMHRIQSNKHDSQIKSDDKAYGKKRQHDEDEKCSMEKLKVQEKFRSN